MSGLKVRPTNPWHINVIYSSGEYLAVVTTWDDKIILGASSDGVNFRTMVGTLLEPSGTGWDNRLYRSALTEDAGHYYLWYSAYDVGTPQVWGIGKTEIIGM
jgi:hypothetical protein